jgi:hypothetical protein
MNHDIKRTPNHWTNVLLILFARNIKKFKFNNYILSLSVIYAAELLNLILNDLDSMTLRFLLHCVAGGEDLE